MKNNIDMLEVVLNETNEEVEGYDITGMPEKKLKKLKLRLGLKYGGNRLYRIVIIKHRKHKLPEERII